VIIQPIFNEKLKNCWIVPVNRKSGAFLIFVNLNQYYQPHPIEAGSHTRIKKLENGPRYAYIELFAAGWHATDYWVEIELLVGEKSFGRSRIPSKFGEHVPIPRVLIPPHESAELRVYIHNIATSQLVQCAVSYSLVEIQTVEYAELLQHPDSRAVYID
jgi:hypothetical protein